MEHTIVFTLIVLTLLQLCRTEISNTIPSGSWFSANVINDGGFSPKPLTEIFSTDSSFVSTSAQVTLPPSSQSTVINEPASTSSPATTIRPSAVSNSQATNAAVPQSVVQLSQFKSSIQTVQAQPNKPLFPPITSQLEPLPPQSKPVQPLLQPIMLQPQPIQPIIQTIPTQPQLIPPQPMQSLLQPLPPQSQPSQSQIKTIENQSTPQPTAQVQFLNPSQPVQVKSPPQPNYFFFYQQAPQSIRTYPLRTPITISQSPPQPVLANSVNPNKLVVASTKAPVVSPIRARPITERVSVQTAAPAIVPQSAGQIPLVKIRMMTPRGTITNVNIIPSSTTMRPATTRSQRTRRPNRVNFDQCVESCGERREPICAGPMAVTPIDPDSLKGFPSTCHLACHNSFRKNVYEKVIEGRCGRLRTRIRTIDSTNKLKRDELNKAQYTIVHSAPQTVVEFSPLSS